MHSTSSTQPADKGDWMNETLIQQLSPERDFTHGTPIQKTYGILCGHRMGSNMLAEGLYQTGLAGDPMEYFNVRMLRMLYKERTVLKIPYEQYWQEMQHRRTSPNGVFGFNIKMDQFNLYFNTMQQQGIDLINSCDALFFLYRKDKIRQAVSTYIGRQRDTFRIFADADYEEVKQKVSTVEYNAAEIANLLSLLIKQDQMWKQFIEDHKLTIVPIAYEDMVANYQEIMETVLKTIGVEGATIPTPPTMKISTDKNEELVERFRQLLHEE